MKHLFLPLCKNSYRGHVNRLASFLQVLLSSKPTDALCRSGLPREVPGVLCHGDIISVEVHGIGATSGERREGERRPCPPGILVALMAI